MTTVRQAVTTQTRQLQPEGSVRFQQQHHLLALVVWFHAICWLIVPNYSQFLHIFICNPKKKSCSLVLMEVTELVPAYRLV